MKGVVYLVDEEGCRQSADIRGSVKKAKNGNAKTSVDSWTTTRICLNHLALVKAGAVVVLDMDLLLVHVLDGGGTRVGEADGRARVKAIVRRRRGLGRPAGHHG